MQLDPSAVRLAVARRQAKETDAAGKLALLRRLQRRYIECRLPRESETRVEQSFNEQLFARILGYRTLLSHDPLPYHLRPKNYALGARRYDDFSLGTFWGDERDFVAASAEFKDPGTNLGAPQTDREDRLTCVEQAFRAARGFPSCRWVIVSNFRDLRLYHIESEVEPLVRLDLHDIRTPKQLAMLAAYFDHEALIGTGGRSGLMETLNPNHASAPVLAADNAFRLVCTFTPQETSDLSLCSVYDAVRATALNMRGMRRDWERLPQVPTTVEDGWVSVETLRGKDTLRLAMSTEGQVRGSIRYPRSSGPAQIHPDVNFWDLANDVHVFLLFVGLLHNQPQKTVEGILSFELREVRLWQINFSNPDLMLKNDETNYGIADNDEVLSGDVLWRVGNEPAREAADCMGELAIQFKSPDGARVRFNHSVLAKHLQPST